jgi:hypothetical protein
VEIFIKIIITLVAIVVFLKILLWTWTSQIDPKATLQKYFNNKPKIADIVVTRDLNKIYQNSNSVGDVTGSVQTKDEQVIFAEITNTSSLDYDKPFEYQRVKLKIVQIGEMIGLQSDGRTTKQSVIKNVVCEKIKD